MKKIITSLFLFLVFLNNANSSEIITKKEGVFIKKEISLGSIKHYYFSHFSSDVKRRDLYIVFPGSKGDAEEFMMATGFHNKIINNNENLIVFDSYKSDDWYKYKSVNDKVVDSVLKEVYNKVYDDIHLVGYAEGATYMNEMVCSNKYGADFIWNVNGTIKKDCEINKLITYSLVYGESMDISNYESNYYTNYENFINEWILKRGKGCKKLTEQIKYGNRFSEAYINQFLFKCDTRNKSNIFKMVGVGRNFPGSSKTDIESFNGRTVGNIDFYDFLEDIF